MNAQFMNATDVGPYPGECLRAWKATREEALHNLGMRDDPDHEGWDRMGPLADPTPANAKNRGEAGTKKKRGDVNMGGTENINETNSQAPLREEGRAEEAVNARSSEMKETWEAMAEAIQDMKMQARQQEIREEIGSGRREEHTERKIADKGDTMGQRESRRERQQERRQQREVEAPDVSTARPTTIHASSAEGQTPLKLTQQRLRERFGADILRQPEETTRQRDVVDENVGTSPLQVGSSATAMDRP